MASVSRRIFSSSLIWRLSPRRVYRIHSMDAPYRRWVTLNWQGKSNRHVNRKTISHSRLNRPIGFLGPQAPVTLRHRLYGPNKVSNRLLNTGLLKECGRNRFQRKIPQSDKVTYRASCLYSIGRGSTKMPVCSRIIQMSSLRLLQLRQKSLHEDATARILAGSRRLDGNTCYTGFTITVTGNRCAEVSLPPRE